jgi:transcriptional regulator with XRE-family HTH domain
MEQIQNTLVSNRKRLGLSQGDVAFLAGLPNDQTVCRHETFTRMPDADTMLAYEVVYKRSASELFGGRYRAIERKVEDRAKLLEEKISAKEPHRGNMRKCQTLRDVAGLEASTSVNQNGNE